MNLNENNGGLNDYLSHYSITEDAAMQIYKQRFYRKMVEYRRWREDAHVKDTNVMDWHIMLKGKELKEEAQMWLKIYLRLKAHQQSRL